jgi:hypothetical protein
MTQAVELKKDVITIGRALDNDIALPNDPEVSRLHAELRLEGGVYVLHDKSRNGTTVNGADIVQQQIYENDEIRVGNTTMTVRGGQLWVPDDAVVKSTGSGVPSWLVAVVGVAVVLLVALVLLGVTKPKAEPVEGVVAVMGGFGTVSGSGTIVDDRGLVLTAASTVGGDPAPLIGVAKRPDLPPANWYVGQVLSQDADLDLAVVYLNKLDSGQPLEEGEVFPALRVGDSDLLDEADAVTVIGYRAAEPVAESSFVDSVRAQAAVISRFVRWPDGTYEWFELDTSYDDPVGFRGGAVVSTGGGDLVGVVVPGDAPTYLPLARPVNLAVPLIDQARRQLGW